MYLNRSYFCSDNTLEKLFPGHISVRFFYKQHFPAMQETLISHYMCMAIIGFAGKRVKHLMLTPVMTVLLGVMDSPEASLLCLEGQIPSSERAPSQLSASPLQRPTQGKYKSDLKINSTSHTHTHTHTHGQQSVVSATLSSYEYFSSEAK